MKFGKTFQDKVIEEWHIYCLDYHSLKDTLKDSEIGCFIIKEDDKKEFFRIVEQSKIKLQNFFKEQKCWALKKYADLERRVAAISSELLRNQVRLSLIEFDRELGLVYEFSQLNWTAFSKIFKKYDKRTCSTIRKQEMEKLKKTNIFFDDELVSLRIKVNDLKASVEQKYIEPFPQLGNQCIPISPKKTTREELKALKIQRKTEAYIAKMVQRSPLFKQSSVEPVTKFTSTEMKLGQKLGEGEYSTVREIQEFFINESCHICFLHKGFDRFHLLHRTTDKMKETEVGNTVTPSTIIFEKPIQLESGTPGTITETNSVVSDMHCMSIQDEDEDEDDGIMESRGFMKDHCIRSGLSRYAVKSLKKSLTGKNWEEANLDLAIEAKFLSVLTHTNIVKMRGTCGSPGNPNFQIILDRLYGTLEERCETWRITWKDCKGYCGIIPNSKKAKYQALWTERLVAAYDISRALNYLHRKKIIFRDLKPQNIGFDIRGQAKIFDFGLAKELLPEDRTGEDQYQASGLTGSLRYMPPEVVACKPYGFSADVYSFALVLWEMFALKVPFDKYDYEKHKKLVAYHGKRPKIPSKWPIEMKELIESSWSHDPVQRPSLFTICELLKCQIGVNDPSIELSQRSHLLLNNSRSSRLGNHY